MRARWGGASGATHLRLVRFELHRVCLQVAVRVKQRHASHSPPAERSPAGFQAVISRKQPERPYSVDRRTCRDSAGSFPHPGDQEGARLARQR